MRSTQIYRRFLIFPSLPLLISCYSTPETLRLAHYYPFGVAVIASESEKENNLNILLKFLEIKAAVKSDGKQYFIYLLAKINFHKLNH
ncbi:MAG: hypothetical protein V7K18_11950 [Nostoc sp.]|uniref:hypothetical protein n=1 Tax=Nostoc sp. TaxID=1180 RepID=UPI002FFAFF61